jgi:hypothetical protein
LEDDVDESRGVGVFNIRCPNFANKNISNVGVCFGVEAGDNQYLITAGHVVKMLASEKHIQIGVKNQWFDINLTSLPVHQGIDIAVYKINGDFVIRNIQLDRLSLEGIDRRSPIDIVWPHEAAIASRVFKGIFLGQCPVIAQMYGLDSKLFFYGSSKPGRSGAPICYSTKEKPYRTQILAVLTGRIGPDSLGIVHGTHISYAVEAIQRSIRNA